MRTRCLFWFVTLALLIPIAACAGGESSDGDRVKIDNDRDGLSTKVDKKDDKIEIEASAATHALLYQPPVNWELTLVAEVAPPEIDGEILQATSVSFEDGVAVVSYNMAGPSQKGAVDVFTFDAERQPTLTARALFNDADVHAVTAHGGKIYLATASADEGFETPAVLEVLGVDGSGQLSLEGHTRVDLSSYAATSVAVGGGAVYVTSGNSGRVYALDEATMEPLSDLALDDARWVAVDGGALVVVQGTPGRLAVLTNSPLSASAEYAFEGAQIPESKSTVELLGGKAFVAGGPGGAFVIGVDGGDLLGHVPTPTGLPLPADEVVTNAVSVDGDLMFVSNGAAGVYLVQAQQDLRDPARGPLSFSVAGRLVFPGDQQASTNHITYKDGFLFVASGRGGLKIVRVDRASSQVDPPAGYPYTTSFDTPTGQAGWTFSGDWGLGVTDGARQAHSERVFIDNDPTLVDQYNHNQADNIALLDVNLTLPQAGLPVLEFWYSQALSHDSDAVYVEVEDPSDQRWHIRATFRPQLDRDTMALHEVWLNSYLGQTVRLRLRQRMAASHGARRFVVDDLRVGALDLPTLSYPLATGFEQEGERARWNLEGAWGWNDVGAHSGESTLDANPEGRSLKNFNSGQVTTMRGWVPIPDEGTPHLGFWYRLALSHPSDRVKVQLQRRGESRWSDLLTFTEQANHAEWTYRELSLAAHAGEAVRVRFVLAFANSDEPRTFVVDDLRFGDLDGDTLDYPYLCGFDTAEERATWVAAGAWGTSSTAFSGEVALDANPQQIPQPNYNSGQIAMMTGFVPLPDDGPIALTYRFQDHLVQSSDRVLVDVQARDDGQWRRLMTYTSVLNRASWSEQELRLDAYAGREVRLRFYFSYTNTLDTRSFHVDDIRIGGLPEARFSYPYRAPFDGDELSEDTWALTGSWALVDTDMGGALDLNPEDLPQKSWGSGHIAQMRGFVELPDSGRPTLTVALRFDLHDSSDRIYIELQTADGGDWIRLRTYDLKLNHPTRGWDEIPLRSYGGQAVRVRLRYSFGASAEARVGQIDDLRIGPLILDNYAWPWANGFESEGARAEWSLWGAWAMSTSHGESVPSAGEGFLDGNPEERILSHFESMQSATLSGYITLPLDELSWLSFEHRFDTAGPSDRFYVEAQRSDSDDWARLATLDWRSARGEYTTLELPLPAYAGQAIRLRFRQSLSASDEVRVITVDDVAVGPITVNPLPFPYTADFSAPEARDSWALSGTWRVTDEGWLDANPDALDLKSYSYWQTATLAGYVQLPNDANAIASFDYILDLVDGPDRVYLEAQREGEPSWTRIETLTTEDNHGEVTSAQGSLSAFAGDSVRFRFRFSFSSAPGARVAAIRQLTINEAP